MLSIRAPSTAATRHTTPGMRIRAVEQRSRVALDRLLDRRRRRPAMAPCTTTMRLRGRRRRPASRVQGARCSSSTTSAMGTAGGRPRRQVACSRSGSRQPPSSLHTPTARGGGRRCWLESTTWARAMSCGAASTTCATCPTSLPSGMDTGGRTWSSSPTTSKTRGPFPPGRTWLPG